MDLNTLNFVRNNLGQEFINDIPLINWIYKQDKSQLLKMEKELFKEISQGLLDDNKHNDEHIFITYLILNN